MIMVPGMMIVTHIHVPHGKPSLDDTPGSPQVRLKVPLPTLGIHVNYHCPTHSKYSPPMTVLAQTVLTPPQDSLRMTSLTSHRYSLSLLTGVSQFVQYQFVLASVLPLVPAIVPAALPLQAVVRIAAKSVLQERGPR